MLRPLRQPAEGPRPRRPDPILDADERVSETVNWQAPTSTPVAHAEGETLERPRRGLEVTCDPGSRSLASRSPVRFVSR